MSNSPNSSSSLPTVIISKCLVGHPCRYDGRAKTSTAVTNLIEEHLGPSIRCALVCPEELGGLGTPRPAAHLESGDGHDVWDGSARVTRVEDGKNVTEAFKAGAKKALLAAGDQVICAIVKARSPSCGCGETIIAGERRQGDGVFTALLKKKNISVTTEEVLALPPALLETDGGQP